MKIGIIEGPNTFLHQEAAKKLNYDIVGVYEFEKADSLLGKSPDLIINNSAKNFESNTVQLVEPVNQTNKKTIYASYPYALNHEIIKTHVTEIDFRRRTHLQNYNSDSIISDLLPDALSMVLKLKIRFLEVAFIKAVSYLNDTVELNIVFDYRDFGKDFKHEVLIKLGYAEEEILLINKLKIDTYNLYEVQLETIKNCFNSNSFNRLISGKDNIIINDICKSGLEALKAGQQIWKKK